ncbi:MAG: MATE family efflux transporter [Planctomycetes bacterium]|nr:MATE family efflux transporter [Planctomycetota bacterium]HJM56460.1 MATE family efflux transporter [Planctomycetota bacterium]
MSPRRRELRTLTGLAVPLVLTHLGSMLMGAVDTAMVGRLNDAPILAAAALANVWISGTSLAAMGILFGLDPVVTQAHGAGKGEQAGRALQGGLVIAILLGLFISALWTRTESVLLTFGQDPELARMAGRYARVQAFSVVPFLLFTALRQYLQGRGILAPALWVTAIANIFNALLNWALIFGHLGLPAMGLQGAGVASGLTRAFMFAALAVMVWRARLYRGAWSPWSMKALHPDSWGPTLRFGAPVCLHLSLEIWAFSYSTLMAGKLGAIATAAHSVVMNVASLTFMIPLGISAAAVTRVGNLIGARRHDDAQRASWVAMGMGAGVMACCGLTIFLLRDSLPGIYTGQQEVLRTCALILPIAAAFQIFDGTQVVGSGILRGMGRTLPAAGLNLVGYWALALPLAHWMAFKRGMGLPGIWWGLAVALAVVALGMTACVHFLGPARDRRRVID